MTPSFRQRLRCALAVLTIGATGAVLFATPASAEPADPRDRYVRAHDHPMGSQIERVEGSATTSSGPRPGSDGGPAVLAGTVYGIDVSGWQKNVDWNYWWNQGKRFAYVKATEGTGYKNPYFTQQYNGSYNRGFIRGAYHFALPNKSSGATQANYFASNGGGWSRDGKTLPGALDMEWNPYGSSCYGKSQAGMRSWIRDFHATYKSRTGRYPVIYTSTSWWNQCVGSGHGLQYTSPIWVARYSSTIGTLPAGWSVWTFWQYSSNPIDQNRFNGAYDRLKALANG